MARKLKKILKKAAPLLAIAGLGKAFMNARNQRAQNKMFAFEEGGNLSRPALPFAKRQVEGLNFPAGTDLSGFDKMTKNIIGTGGVDNYKTGGIVVKTGEKTKKLKKKKSIQVRGFGKARK